MAGNSHIKRQYETISIQYLENQALDEELGKVQRLSLYGVGFKTEKGEILIKIRL